MIDGCLLMRSSLTSAVAGAASMAKANATAQIAAADPRARRALAKASTSSMARITLLMSVSCRALRATDDSAPSFRHWAGTCLAVADDRQSAELRTPPSPPVRLRRGRALRRDALE